MMRYFVIASASTGAILRSCGVAALVSDDELRTWAGPLEEVIFTDEMIKDQKLWRIVDGALVERETMEPTVSAFTIAADGLQTAVISNLPDPCYVIVRGIEGAPPSEVVGGSITLTASTPGEINVLVLANPIYKPWETMIHAV